MKGDDVLAFDLNSEPARGILVGEAKFRSTPSKASGRGDGREHLPGRIRQEYPILAAVRRRPAVPHREGSERAGC